jgi:uncharacterized membrane protein
MYELFENGLWMGYNTVLALIPLLLAAFLFTGTPRHRFVWWVGVVAFVAFLPNGPYVITDIKHYPGDAALLQGKELARVLLAFEYGVFVLVGVAAYVGSLEVLRRYLRARVWTRRHALEVEFALHALSAVGVLLGRFARFNSWDIGTRPEEVLGHATSRLDRPASWLLLITTFAVIVTATWLVRMVANTAGHVWQGMNGRT